MFVKEKSEQIINEVSKGSYWTGQLWYLVVAF